MKNRRSVGNILRIESEFKKRQILRVLGFTACFVALTTALLAFFYTNVLHPELARFPGIRWGFTGEQSVWRQIPELPLVLVTWVTMMSAISTLFAVGVGLHFSHRLAGPLYRIKGEFRRIADGRDARPISLRAGDDFQDVADAANAAISWLQSQAGGSANEDLERYRETCAALRETLERFDPTDLCEGDAASVEALRVNLRDLLAKCEAGNA